MSTRDERAQRIAEKLRRELGPDICDLLVDPTVVEIVLNEAGVLWVERLGEPMKPFGKMAAAQAESLMATVASTVGVDLTRDNPILECELPFDGSRFSAVIPPVVEGPAFAIRRRAIKVFSLDDYVEQGVMTEAQRDLIGQAVIHRQNLLVVGGTGSGKTTLANALIEHIARGLPDDRLVIIEDTREIQCSSKNKLQMRVTGSVTMDRLLKHTLRQRPDRIIVGEVRGAEAMTLLKAWNTGHPGGVATIHANGAKAGLTRLEQMISEATAAPMQRLIGQAVDWVVFIARAPGGRRVEDVIRVREFDGHDYITTNGAEYGAE